MADPVYTNVEFSVAPKNMTFITKVNGDALTIAEIVLSADQAAQLAYLINSPGMLCIEIKKRG